MKSVTISTIILSVLTLLASSCKKTEAIYLDYFYTEERTTLFFDDFSDNSNNWVLSVDTTNHDNDTYYNSTNPDTNRESSAEIINGTLNLFANNNNWTSATLNLSHLNLNSLDYICLEIHFKRYRTRSNYQASSGKSFPNFFKFDMGEHQIKENGKLDNSESLEGVINILYNPEINKVFIAKDDNKAEENLYFSLEDNITNLKNITFAASTFRGGDALPRNTGNTIVDKIEVYTITP